MSSLSVMILAGGQSRRMGQDKALLKVDGEQTLLASTVNIARSLTSDVLIVTPWPERYQPLFSVALPSPVSFVRETANPTGPLTGFAVGWPQVSADWCLLLACDLPCLEVAALQTWWQWLCDLERDAPKDWSCDRTLLAAPGAPIASLAKSEMGDSRHGPSKLWEPLCGFYHRRCLPSLMAYVSGGQRSFQGWLSEQSSAIAVYTAAPPQLFLNWNRPEDLP
ncbi:MAG: NTP transferase domain-containing protein [Cyanobacteria bacterium J06627_28]